MENKVALVTGAASGLGFATSKAGTALIPSDLNEDSCKLKLSKFQKSMRHVTK